jgi:hypothetical protein
LQEIQQTIAGFGFNGNKNINPNQNHANEKALGHPGRDHGLNLDGGTAFKEFSRNEELEDFENGGSGVGNSRKTPTTFESRLTFNVSMVISMLRISLIGSSKWRISLIICRFRKHNR